MLRGGWGRRGCRGVAPPEAFDRAVDWTNRRSRDATAMTLIFTLTITQIINF